MDGDGYRGNDTRPHTHHYLLNTSASRDCHRHREATLPSSTPSKARSRRHHCGQISSPINHSRRCHSGWWTLVPTEQCPTATLSAPEIVPPPAKRTRKRRNEVELLRASEPEGKLLLSPPTCPATPPSREPPPSSPSPDLPTQPTLPASQPSVAPPPMPPGVEPASPPLDPPAPPTLPVSPPSEAQPAKAPPATPPPTATLLTDGGVSPAPLSPLGFRTLPTPPPTEKLPTSWHKVLCRECYRDPHNIAYRHCIECDFKENGYP
jgi:hypothetical protein